MKAEEDWLSIPDQHELGRNGSVVSPDLVDLLCRQIRVELERNRSRRVDTRIHGRRNLWVVSGIGLSAFHKTINNKHKQKQTKQQKRPDRSWRTSFDGTCAAAQCR